MSQDSGTQQLTAVAFETALEAEEALEALASARAEQAIELGDAVAVIKQIDGSVQVRQTTDLTPGRAALGGGWWGLFVGLVIGGPVIGGMAGAAGGAVLGKLIDAGLSDRWVKDFAVWLRPGSSALLALVMPRQRQRLLAVVGRGDPGQVLDTEFPDRVLHQLEELSAAAEHEPPSGRR